MTDFPKYAPGFKFVVPTKEELIEDGWVELPKRNGFIHPQYPSNEINSEMLLNTSGVLNIRRPWGSDSDWYFVHQAMCVWPVHSFVRIAQKNKIHMQKLIDEFKDADGKSPTELLASELEKMWNDHPGIRYDFARELDLETGKYYFTSVHNSWGNIIKTQIALSNKIIEDQWLPNDECIHVKGSTPIDGMAICKHCGVDLEKWGI